LCLCLFRHPCSYWPVLSLKCSEPPVQTAPPLKSHDYYRGVTYTEHMPIARATREVVRGDCPAGTTYQADGTCLQPGIISGSSYSSYSSSGYSTSGSTYSGGTVSIRSNGAVIAAKAIRFMIMRAHHAVTRRLTLEKQQSGFDDFGAVFLWLYFN